MQLAKRYGWVAAVLVGLAFVVLGSLYVGLGVDASNRIRAALAEEHVTTGQDASIPGVPVLDAATAEAQAALIKEDTLGQFGPYALMARDDPNRDVYLKGLILRNSLGLSVLGFGVADLAVGTGAIVILLGFTSLGLLAPVLYAVRGVAPGRPRAGIAEGAASTGEGGGTS